MILISLLANNLLPLLLVSQNPIFWNYGSLSKVTLISILVFSVVFAGFIMSFRTKVRFLGGYRVSIRNNSVIFWVILILCAAFSVFTYLKFGNSLRSVTPGAKGLWGFFAYLIYCLSHACFLMTLLAGRHWQAFLWLPVLFFVANGTYGWLFWLLAVAVVLQRVLKLRPLTLVVLAPAILPTTILAVLYSKSGSISNLIELLSSAYIFELPQRISERVNLFNWVASYQLDNPHNCDVLGSIANEYRWGFQRVGLVTPTDPQPTYSQCVYMHFSNHGVQAGTGLSIGFVASLFSEGAFVLLTALLAILFVLSVIMQNAVVDKREDVRFRLLEYLIVIAFFVPMLDSAVDSFILFQVSGLKLAMIVFLCLFCIKLVKGETDACHR